MRKLIIGLFFVLCLFIAMPMPAQAADYNLWVGGVRVTDDNKDGVTGAGIEGTVSYNPATKTLTLDDADITSVYTDTAPFYVGNTYGIYFDSTDLTINLVGDSSITVPDNPGHSSEGISSQVLNTGALDIQGTGTLTVSVGAGSYTAGISSSRGTVTIGGNATVTVTTGPAANSSYGIFCQLFPITIEENAQVTVTVSGSANGSKGLLSNGSILITDDAVVNATALGTSTGINGHTYGICASNGTLTISNHAVVTAAGGATAGEYSYSRGVHGITVEVLGSAQLTATGGDTGGTGSSSYGVFGYDSVTFLVPLRLPPPAARQQMGQATG